MSDELITWGDIPRIKDKEFLERARRAIVKRETGKAIEDMTKADLDLIIRNGCQDHELIDRIKKNLQAKGVYC